MTAFITRCWKKAQLNLLVLCCAFALGSGSTPSAVAQTAPPAELTGFRLERTDEGLFLSTNLRFDLPAPVEEALEKGIPIHFVAEAELRRDRWYWYDRTVATSMRYWRLAYQPLTRRWRLNSGATPISASGQGVSFTQHFETLPEALSALRRISRWKIAEAGDIESGVRHNVDFRFRLDVAQLPRPFQIAGVGQSEWAISIVHNQRLPAEAGR